MADYHKSLTQKFHSVTELFTMVAVIICSELLCCHSSFAQQPEFRPEQSESQQESNVGQIAELQKQLRTISNEITQSFQEEGLSQKALQAQQKLIVVLEGVIKQPVPSPDSSSPQPNGEAAKESPEKPSLNNNSPGSTSGTSAGQAAAGENLPIKFDDLTQRENLSDAVWGHLPSQERNDLLRTYSESYLPGYELQVRQYFEKLARLRQRTASDTEKP